MAVRPGGPGAVRPGEVRPGGPSQDRADKTDESGEVDERDKTVGLDESLSRASYFLCALGILAEAGPAALTIAELGQRLGVTKGSFYHHFDGRAQFVDALLDHWKTEHAARLIEISRSIDDTQERMSLLKQIAIGLSHDAEAAIRAWSFQDARVAEAQAEVDGMRTVHLRDAYSATGMDASQAELWATIAMSVLAGMQLLIRPSDPHRVRHIFDQVQASMFEATDRRT
jgi:AcrR family transcriptional regulator